MISDFLRLVIHMLRQAMRIHVKTNGIVPEACGNLSISGHFEPFKKNLFSANCTKGLEVFRTSVRLDRLRLFNGKAFHKPAEFLPCQELCFGRVPWPLEPPAAVKPFG